MAKFVRVDIPSKQPKDTLNLCDSIIAKDTAEGVNSTLAGVIDMTAFASKVTAAKAKRASATLKDQEAVSKYEIAATHAGLAKGQTKDDTGTIYWYVVQVRDILLVVHKGNEESLSQYGYHVVITQNGARRIIKVELPSTMDDMIELGKAIVARHTLLGAGSPLIAALVDMTTFETLVNDTETMLTDWAVLRGEVQALNNEALNIIGYGVGQTISTAGTIYFELSKIRTRLLQKFQGIEESISKWGFNVVESTGTTGRKKGSKKISLQGKVTDKATHAPIANALLHVVETDTYITTDAQGKFVIYGLAPGTYTIEVHKAGYPDFQVPDVMIKASVVTLNIELPVSVTEVRQGDLAFNVSTAFDVAGFNSTPLSMVTLEITGNVRISATGTLGGGDGATFWDLTTGTYTKTLAEFAALVGADSGHTFIHINNLIGPGTAHWKMTFTNLGN